MKPRGSYLGKSLVQGLYMSQKLNVCFQNWQKWGRFGRNENFLHKIGELFKYTNFQSRCVEQPSIRPSHEKNGQVFMCRIKPQVEDNFQVGLMMSRWLWNTSSPFKHVPHLWALLVVKHKFNIIINLKYG